MAKTVHYAIVKLPERIWVRACDKSHPVFDDARTDYVCYEDGVTCGNCKEARAYKK